MPWEGQSTLHESRSWGKGQSTMCYRGRESNDRWVEDSCPTSGLVQRERTGELPCGDVCAPGRDRPRRSDDAKIRRRKAQPVTAHQGRSLQCDKRRSRTGREHGCGDRVGLASRFEARNHPRPKPTFGEAGNGSGMETMPGRKLRTYAHVRPLRGHVPTSLVDSATVANWVRR